MDIQSISAKKMNQKLKFSTVVILVFLFGVQFCEGFVNKFKGEDAWLMQFVKELPVQEEISLPQSDKCRCGHASNYSERIVGGVVSKKSAWPWVGAIVFMGDTTPKILCGVSIINELYLLTASHCAEHLTAHGMEKFQVFLGTNDLNDTDAIVPELDKVILHPKYNSDTKAYDVALLRLKTPIKFLINKVAPICIVPQRGAPYQGDEALVVGWGTLMFGGVSATMQMQTMVNVTSNKICTEKYLKSAEPVKITPMMMCASAPGSDSCQGDSGGPLFLKRDDTFVQIGIVSFGSGCADKRYPGVYTRLGKVVKWIKSVTKDSVYCDI